jgi:hypothetical protein
MRGGRPASRRPTHPAVVPQSGGRASPSVGLRYRAPSRSALRSYGGATCCPSMLVRRNWWPVTRRTHALTDREIPSWPCALAPVRPVGMPDAPARRQSDLGSGPWTTTTSDPRQTRIGIRYYGRYHGAYGKRGGTWRGHLAAGNKFPHGPNRHPRIRPRSRQQEQHSSVVMR